MTLTLPGTIAGLLRRGSPVVTTECWRGIVLAPGMSAWLDPVSGVQVPSEHEPWRVHLDLSDVTARWHAALWLNDTDAAECIMDPRERDAYTSALMGCPMSDGEIEHLVALVMRWAEPQPADG